MSKWHAHVAHMAKNMNMVGGTFGGGAGPLGLPWAWWGGRAPWAPLNPVLTELVYITPGTSKITRWFYSWVSLYRIKLNTASNIQKSVCIV